VPEKLLASGIKCWGSSEPENLKEKQFYSFSRNGAKVKGTYIYPQIYIPDRLAIPL